MASRSIRTVAGLLLGALMSFPAAAQPHIVKEGEGTRRGQLDAMELKPFAMSNLDKLTDWTNGAAPTSGALDGRVVLVLFYNDWYPSAAKTVNVAKRLAEKHPGELVVIAAHDKEGWKDARKPKSEVEGAHFLLAHDAKNELRAALRQDQDPDFYLIDRAGQLRYADIATESVENAVDYLVQESKDRATGLNAELAAKAKQDDLEARRSAAIRNKVDMTDIPEVPFQQPLPEEYDKKKVRWPYMPRDPNLGPEDPKNPDPPIVVALPETGFFPKKPTMKGRAVLLYFWHPDLPYTFQLFDPMDTLQRQHARDLVVIGVMSPLNVTTGSGNKEYKLDADPKALKERIESIMGKQHLRHTMILDVDGAILKTCMDKDTQVPIPYGALISSDNTLRYKGLLGTSPFRGAIDRLLDVDPAIRARRAAENDYLRSRNK